MTNITNYLNKIKAAVYGKDVRGAIHDAIKQVYDDASVEHDNANMEVKLARGTHNTLNDRLDNVDEIQAQTNAQLSELANKGTTVEVIERATKEEIDRQIADGTLATLMIEDGSIATEKYKNSSITLHKLSSDLIHMVADSVKLNNTNITSKYLQVGFNNGLLTVEGEVAPGQFRAINLPDNIIGFEFTRANATFIKIGNKDKYVSINLSYVHNDDEAIIVGMGEDNIRFTPVIRYRDLEEKPPVTISNNDRVRVSLINNLVYVEVDKHNGSGFVNFLTINLNDSRFTGYYEGYTFGFLYGGSSSQIGNKIICTDLITLGGKMSELNQEISSVKNDMMLIENSLSSIREQILGDKPLTEGDVVQTYVDIIYTDGILQYVEAPESYRGVCLFKDTNHISFITCRNMYWVIIGHDGEGTYTVLGIGGNYTGQIATLNTVSKTLRVLYQCPGIYEEKLSKNMKLEIENYDKTITISLLENDAMNEWFSIKKADYPLVGFDTLITSIGLFTGVSEAESPTNALHIAYDVIIGDGGINGRLTAIEDKISNLSFEPIKEKRKQAIVIVAGQSNAVGYDESPVKPLFNGRLNPRVKQLGFYTKNLEIIPLTHCAESYQNMTTVSGHPTGTKGIHLPLGNLIEKDLPEDYEVCFVSCAYGGTGFTTSASYGTFDETTLKPSNGGLRWGVNSAYYKAMKARLKYLLDLNEENIFLGVVWIQGEHDSGNASGHFSGFQEMTNDFFNYFNTNGYGNRVKKGTFDKDCWFNVETVFYWYGVGQCQQIWDNYRVWNPNTYIEIPRNTDSNAINGTGKTASNRDAHFGNDTYTTVIAPRVYEKFKNQI